MERLSEIWWEWKERPWKPVSIFGIAGCLMAFAILAYPQGKTALGTSPLAHMLVIIPHEGGHMIVNGALNLLGVEYPSPFLLFVVVAAGTLGQLLAVLIPAGIYLYRKSATPLALFVFLFFASLPGIGIYMMDCRVLMLDYIAPGGADYEAIQLNGQDWTRIFRYLHIPFGTGEHLGRIVYWVGWLGMLPAAAWPCWMFWRTTIRPLSAETAVLAAPEVPPATSASAYRGSETLLILGTDVRLNQQVAPMLRRKGYAVLQAATPAEVAARTSRRRPDVLIAKYAEEAAAGFPVLSALRASDPALPAILVLAAGEAPDERVLPAGAILVAEPLTGDSFAAALRQLLDSPASRSASI